MDLARKLARLGSVRGLVGPAKSTLGDEGPSIQPLSSECPDSEGPDAEGPDAEGPDSGGPLSEAERLAAEVLPVAPPPDPRLERLRSPISAKLARSAPRADGLGRSEGQGAGPEAEVPQGEGAALRSPFGTLGAEGLASPVGTGLGTWLGAEARETEHGRLLVREQRLLPDHCHGKSPIGAALQTPMALLAAFARDPRLAGVDPRRMLLLDTETTGLSGGTGTVPFLIGLAWFEDESLTLAQLLLPRPGEERPMLAFLAERLAAASVLVTYNGKSFDLPLLQTRFVLHRLFIGGLPPHLDLLHPARRIYRRRLGAVRLVHLEEKLLGFRRERDVEGHEIPSIYWSAVRRGGGPLLERVLEHNANDVIALAGIMARVGAALERVEATNEPEDQLSIAEQAFRNREDARTVAFAEAAAAGGGPRAVTVAAEVLLARVAQRQKSLPAVAHHLRAALAAAGTDKVLAGPVHLRLARLCEHTDRDFLGARQHALAAARFEPEDLHLRRLARLERRLEGAGMLSVG